MEKVYLFSATSLTIQNSPADLGVVFYSMRHKHKRSLSQRGCNSENSGSKCWLQKEGKKRADVSKGCL